MELNVTFDTRSKQPMHYQLYSRIRKAILHGELLPGQRVPSTRELSEALSISRTTVMLGYEQLMSEGYLEASHGSGTYVSKQLPEELLQTDEKNDGAAIKQKTIPISRYGKRLADFDPYDKQNSRLAVQFRHGRPDYKVFPMKTWRRLMLRHCRSLKSSMLDYADSSQGFAPLREAIAQYVSRSRAVRCTADNIVIVNGSQQALDLISRIMLNPGDAVAVENPGYLGAFRAFEAQGAEIIPVAVDDDGLKVNDLERLKKKVKLVYVTPSHQFPTGSVLSLSRRLELLEFALRTQTLIVEDDYDSEYRYEARPLPALQGMDETGSVLYIGTFSKVLFPALRLGYFIVPEQLVEVLSRAKWTCDRQAPLLEQYVLNDFIREGFLERHLRRMRVLYNQRRRILVDCLRKNLGSKVTIRGENAGMHLMIRIQTSLSAEEILNRAHEHGVGLLNAKRYYLKRAPSNEFVLGYANLTEREIQDGIQRIATALKE